VASVILAIALGIIWVGPEPLVERLSQGQATSSNPQAETFFLSRGWIWRDTLAMIKSSPITGVGLGAFETAFPAYSHGDGSLSVSEAHNDYLQVVADGGLVGGILAVWFIVVAMRNAARGLRTRDPLRAGVALGAGVSITGLLVHSFFDFNLQLPAHALLFLVFSAVVSHLGARVTEPAVALIESIEPRRDVLISAAGH
jgi:O-antigen ligase